MGRGKKIGVVLILTGICIPILAMLFASGYNSRQDIIWNVQHTEIFLWEKTIPITYDPLGINSNDQDGPWKDYKRFKIPEYNTHATFPADVPTAEMERALRETFPPKVIRYVVPSRYFFALGIILTTIGLGLVIMSKDGKTRTEQGLFRPG